MHTTITFDNIDYQKIHNQIQQLEQMQQGMMPDDSVEAITLSDTIKLLTEIEHALEQEIHH